MLTHFYIINLKKIIIYIFFFEFMFLYYYGIMSIMFLVLLSYRYILDLIQFLRKTIDY